MADSLIKITTTGWEQVIRKLGELKESTHKPLMRRAMLRAAQVIRDNARAKVPVRTGSLRKAIVAQTNRSQKSGEVRAQVGIARLVFQLNDKGKRKRVGRYGGRNGTATDLEAKTARPITPRRYGHLVEFGTPRAAAHPFMRPAFDTTPADELLAPVVEYMKAEIDRLTK